MPTTRSKAKSGKEDKPGDDNKQEKEWSAKVDKAKKELKDTLGKHAEDMRRIAEELRASAMKYDAVLQKVELERSRRGRLDQRSCTPKTRDLRPRSRSRSPIKRRIDKNRDIFRYL